MSQVHSVVSTPTFKQQRDEVAYAAIKAEMAALDPAALLPINLDVVTSVTIVVGSLAEIRAVRADIARDLPSFDLARFDRLEAYALGLSHAQALYRGANAPSSALSVLGAELNVVRDRLLAAAQPLIEFGLIDGNRLKDCKMQPGYRPLAADLQVLVAVFKEHWSEIEGKTPVSPAMLDDAGTRALELLEAVGQRDQGPATTGHAAEQRQRAYTLFIRAYDDARRAIGYLRAAQGDAEKIAPSLWSSRRTRGRADDAASDTVTESETTASNSTDSMAPTPAPSDDIIIDNRAGFPITHPLSH